MEDEKHKTTPRLDPPHSLFSNVLNEMSNGGILAAAAFSIHGAWHQYFNKHYVTPHSHIQKTILATVVGSALGAAYGFYLDREQKNYHNNIARNFEELRARLDAKEASQAR